MRPIQRRVPFATVVTAFAAVLVLCLTGVALAELTPQPVRDTKAMEYAPAASADYLAWSKVTSTDPWNAEVWAVAYGHKPFRVSPRGTDAAPGGIDGTTLVYQEYSRKTDKSDIFFFDLATKVRSAAPGKINTAKRWEESPTISGDWVLFDRVNVTTGDQEVLLYNTATDELRTIAQVSGWRRGAVAGQVNGSYAVWEKWTPSTYDVFLYDIGAETTTQIPNPRDRAQYAPSVNPAGAVFYGRSGWYCGRNAMLTAYPIGGPAETLVSFRSGRDFYTSYALDNGDGTTDVFYDPSPCTGTRNWDIFKVTYSIDVGAQSSLAISGTRSDSLGSPQQAVPVGMRSGALSDHGPWRKNPAEQARSTPAG